MEKYIGIKIVQAEPAWCITGKNFNRIIHPLCCSSNLPDGEMELGYRVIYSDGYESWSPKAVFDEAYRRSDNMNFGLAIEAMKKGFRVARYGWNGKNMSVAYQKGYPDGIPCNKNTAEA